MKLSHIILIGSIFWSCQEKSSSRNESVKEFQNKGHELVYKMVQTVGTYSQLAELKDVVYTYTYRTPDGKEDVSTEQYIFDGELSQAVYHKHERTLPGLEGEIEQGFDGANFWIKNNEAYLDDEAAMSAVIFNRKTNFYWFAMMQKLLDEGLIYEYIKEETIDNTIYDVVKVSFQSENGKPTDIYQLYINRDTSIVDQFLFTVVDRNVVESPMLMRMEYEEIEGLLIPTKREYKKSTWEAEVSDAPWIEVNWSGIKFNNNMDRALFSRIDQP